MTINPHSVPGLYVGDYQQVRGQTSPAVVPADVLDKHLLIAGQTGAGKSTTATQAIRTGHATTDGATIVIDPKGDGWPAMIGRAVYADRCVMGPHSPADVFDDVSYFDAEYGLPHLPLCDLRPALEAGVTRIDAAKAVADDVVTMIELLLPDDDDAVRAPDVITNLVLALFDPEYGDEVYGISDLYAAAAELSESRSTPAVSTDWLQQILDGTATGSERVFGAIQQGVNTRLMKMVQDPYLRSMFDAVGGRGFELTRILDDDVLILIDISAVTPRAQRVIARTVVRRLWRALEWRQASLRPHEDPTQVSLWIDEVPQLQLQDELSQLLAMGRGLGLSVVPMMQFPAQLRDGSGGERVYREVLNNVGSVLCGHLDNPSMLVETLATPKTSAEEAAELLGNCPDDRWVFSPATSRSLRSSTSPLTMLRDPPLPPGHPDGAIPLSAAAHRSFEEAWDECRHRTIDEAGVVPVGYGSESDDPVDNSMIERGLQHTLWLDTVSLPDGVAYAYGADELYCTACGTAFLPRFERLVEASTHCQTARDPPAAAFPITDIGLPEASPDRVRNSPLSLREIMFLRLVERAERREIDRREWDVTEESMLPLRNTLGLETDAEAALAEAGYLSRQPDFRGSFYRLTQAGKEALTDVRGGAGPPGTHPGDPSESVAHIRLIETAADALEAACADESTPLERVERYWSPPDQQVVVDVVALDETGTPLVAVEGERQTNDLKTGAPADYDVLAGLESAAALWVVPDRATGHNVVEALIDPADDTSRLDMTTSDIAAKTTALTRYEITADGCAAIVTAGRCDQDVILDVLD